MPKKVRLDTLSVNAILDSALYSVNGERLVSRGMPWTSDRLDAFSSEGFDTAYLPDPDEGEGHCRYQLAFEKCNISHIDRPRVLAEPIADQSGRLLVQQNKSVAPDMLDTLARQGIEEVTIRREFTDELVTKVERVKSHLNKIARRESTNKIAKDVAPGKVEETRKLDGLSKVSPRSVKGIEESESTRKVQTDSDTRTKLEGSRLTRWETDDDRQRILEVRTAVFKEIVGLFEQLQSGKTIDTKKVDQIIKLTIGRIVADRFHRLHITAEGEDKHYIASHSLSTLILSINIAGRLNFSMDEIIELGYSALLHQIGMLKVPREIREKSDDLASSERQMIEAYPSHSLGLCEQFKGIPCTTPVVMYQVNERLDASGYPRGLDGKSLHPYSKIVAIASSYDAMIRERPYRDAKHPYKAMEEVLYEVNKGRYDVLSARGLLETLGLFPIGSGVVLSDGRYGRVLDSLGTNYTRPVVYVELDAKRQPLPRNEVIDLQEEGYETLQIVRAVAPPFDISAEDKNQGSSRRKAATVSS